MFNRVRKEHKVLGLRGKEFLYNHGRFLACRRYAATSTTAQFGSSSDEEEDDLPAIGTEMNSRLEAATARLAMSCTFS